MAEPTKRFSNRVEDYIKYRPKYPIEIITVLKQDGILIDETVIADIGSGTGIFTKLLLETGCKTFAVEPNIDMRQAAEQHLINYNNLVSIDGQAETTTLEDNTIDLVTVAQAFHWFDRVKTRKEFVRILKPNGYLALVWNNRLKDNTPFQISYNDLLIEHCPGHEKTNHYKITDDQIAEFYGTSEMKIFTCAYHQIFDFDGLKGRLFSSSYTPKETEPNYQPLLSSLKVLFDKYQVNGQVQFDYTTKMYYGTLSSNNP